MVCVVIFKMCALIFLFDVGLLAENAAVTDENGIATFTQLTILAATQNTLSLMFSCEGVMLYPIKT